MENQEQDTRHERSDVKAGSIAMLAVAGLFLAAVMHVGVWTLFKIYEAAENRKDAGRTPLATKKTPPEPRLQVDLSADLPVMRAEENARLNSYGWINRKAGIARIPIKRAMERMVKNKPKNAGRESLQ